MQKLLNRMVELQTLQFQLKGKMQVISEQKKQVFATLRKSMSKFYRIARIALETDPQQMEVAGISSESAGGLEFWIFCKKT